jgi:hypothetical protein
MRSPAVKVDLPEGIYPIHCSVFCGIGHPSMKARLVVGVPPPAPGSRLPWIAHSWSAARSIRSSRAGGARGDSGPAGRAGGPGTSFGGRSGASWSCGPFSFWSSFRRRRSWG